MNHYTFLVKRQRKLLGFIRANFKAKSKLLFKMGLVDAPMPQFDEPIRKFQIEYNQVTEELEIESRKLIEKGLNPYDYAPEPEYIPNDDEE